MVRTQDCDHVVSQGTIRDGATRVDFYTTIPTPSQWIAVGVLVVNDREEKARRPQRMLVGTGRDEDTAIADLRTRFKHVRNQLQTQKDRTAARRTEENRNRRNNASPATRDPIFDPDLTPADETPRA